MTSKNRDIFISLYNKSFMFKGRKNEIKGLARLSTLVNSSLDIMDVLNNAMKYVEELMDAEASSIFEVDYDRNELFFRVARGKEGNKARQTRLSMGEGIAGQVAVEGKPLLVQDVYRNKHFARRIDKHTGFKTRSIICVPIKHKGRLIGVLEVLNKRCGPFNEEDLGILTVVSNQVGIAMENARLYQRLQEKFTLTADELRKTQQKLIQSERLADLGRLSQGVAHEVRNRITCIGGFARRLRQKFSAEDPACKYVDIILKETGRLEKVVLDVEAYSNLRKPMFREVNLEKLIKKAVEGWLQSRPDPEIQVHLDLPDGEITFPGDNSLLSLALTNLFENARDAMREGGRLSISAQPKGQEIIITVADTGSGIAQEDIPHIFDPLFSSKPQASGLGLTTVHRIVTEHNGDITVKSTPRQGTEFKIHLPISPDDIQMSELEGSQTQ